MKKLKILLIGGTKDASNITQHIKENYDSYILTTTTTEYGSKLAIESGSDDTIAKPLLKDEFIKLIENNDFNLLIDATHPYASHITQTSVSLSEICNINYIRFERLPSNLENIDTSRVHEVTSLDEAGKLIKSNYNNGNVLHLAGANTMENILKYVPVSKFYARILKVPKSLEKCESLRIPEDHIIPMKGTSSLEENIKIIEETNADVIITKESGDIGGVTNKINAANAKDIDIIMLKRPKIKNLNKKDIISNLNQLDEKINNYFYN
ncbi:precorrin-6A reductase [uncultured Methanobrevibacter sp.]|uniref:precorrin-6A reductase n=1 Tax=uncultured Methanobrevibacter sp. TaxID=253161 RepID=UPI00262AC6C1|nr:precorrin-6A reductase [uncultured Methanobrevibacter sp.]